MPSLQVIELCSCLCFHYCNFGTPQFIHAFAIELTKLAVRVGVIAITYIPMHAASYSPQPLHVFDALVFLFRRTIMRSAYNLSARIYTGFSSDRLERPSDRISLFRRGTRSRRLAVNPSSSTYACYAFFLLARHILSICHRETWHCDAELGPTYVPPRGESQSTPSTFREV